MMWLTNVRGRQTEAETGRNRPAVPVKGRQTEAETARNWPAVPHCVPVLAQRSPASPCTWSRPWFPPALGQSPPHTLSPWDWLKKQHLVQDMSISWHDSQSSKPYSCYNKLSFQVSHQNLNPITIQSFQVSHQNLIPVTIYSRSKSVTKPLFPLQYTVIPSQSPKPYSCYNTFVPSQSPKPYSCYNTLSLKPYTCYNTLSFQVSHHNLLSVTIHCCSKSVTITFFLLQYTVVPSQHHMFCILLIVRSCVYYTKNLNNTLK